MKKKRFINLIENGKAAVEVMRLFFVFCFLWLKVNVVAIALFILWLVQGTISKADAIDDIIKQVEKEKAFIAELSQATIENEGYKLKAYKCPGGQWTICQGITRFKSPKQLKGRQCYLMDKNHKKKGFWCMVKKKDIATPQMCDRYFNDYARYLLKKLRNSIIDFDNLKKEQKGAIFDLFFYYGESKENARHFLIVFNELQEIKKMSKNSPQEVKNFNNELFFLKQQEQKKAIEALIKKGPNFTTKARIEKIKKKL